MQVAHHKTDVPTQIRYFMDNNIGKRIAEVIVSEEQKLAHDEALIKVVKRQRIVIKQLEKVQPKLILLWILKKVGVIKI